MLATREGVEPPLCLQAVRHLHIPVLCVEGIKGDLIMGKNQRAIYSADTWHVDDGTGTDGGDRRKNPVRRVFAAEYKLSILAEYEACSESGDKGALLRREGLYLTRTPVAR